MTLPAPPNSAIVGQSREYGGKRPAIMKSGPAACAAGPHGRPSQEENWKIVVELKVLPGLSTVLRKSGSFGEFGKCWVSNV